jgi:hypothetical protein
MLRLALETARAMATLIAVAVPMNRLSAATLSAPRRVTTPIEAMLYRAPMAVTGGTRSRGPTIRRRVQIPRRAPIRHRPTPRHAPMAVTAATRSRGLTIRQRAQIPRRLIPRHGRIQHRPIPRRVRIRLLAAGIPRQAVVILRRAMVPPPPVKALRVVAAVRTAVASSS